jgi:spore maturation protein CgeB
MNIVMFYHSLVSDWNHGNAHFLRGVVRELKARGHRVKVYEPENGWSVSNLVRDHTASALQGFYSAFPGIRSIEYSLESLRLDRALNGADLVLVHEWNDPELVRRIGKHRARHGGYKLLFHDTHHRAVTAPSQMEAYDLSEYDGVLAFGEVLRRIYLDRGWTGNAWTWHEAADTALFRPLRRKKEDDVVWVGNWGDDERSEELHAYLIRPVQSLRLRASVHGVRYPQAAVGVLDAAQIQYKGWLPNYRVPEVFARNRLTLHVPRRPYTRALPGIPTIRVFESLACGIPLITAPWDDSERLFKVGTHFLMAHSPKEMRDHLRLLLADPDLARTLARRGRRKILARHTCAHRVDELLAIADELGVSTEMEMVV